MANKIVAATFKKAPKNKRQLIAKPVAHSPWNFHEITGRGLGAISSWIESANWSDKTRANFDRSIEQLRPLPKQLWSKPNPASKIGDNTYVIRFKDVTAAQLRFFGHFFDSHNSFVITTQGFEKDDVYYPKNYQALAQSRRVDCDKDFSGKTIPFETLCSICSKSTKDDDDGSKRLQKITDT